MASIADWLGMGRSSRPKWTIAPRRNETWGEIVQEVEEHFVQSLEDWRQKMGLEKMTLMGHSLGGYFAVCYALKHPTRVEKLILVSPAGIAEGPRDQELKEKKPPRELLDREASQLNASLQEEANAAEAIARTSVPVRQIPSWVRYLWDRNITPMSIVRLSGPFGARLVNGYTSRRFAHLSTDEQHDLYDYLYNITSSTGSGEYALAAILAPGAYARKPLLHRLSQLQMPTVFIYGEHDWMDYRAAEKASKNMKVPTKIVRIPGGGHHMYLDESELFDIALAKEMA
ncbi:hypothetical protein EC973_005373 [Apophysomyces ossiformis]|uniref:AB hydrolase-1 domain-containing protein n=1 Tax=Apophysomyces ossiformis TaxID=679940 RepID=A0A8H7BDZ5_9FUNG|nr:hypothetical protein EC973_005373 [Apophysomyces ossiformis]